MSQSIMESKETARKGWKPPTLIAKSDSAARPDQNNPIDASEYLDDPDTLQSKVKAVAQMLKQARHCVCYTGAGISKASGIPDYATRAIGSLVGSIERLQDPHEAQPTIAHDALASLYRAGYVKEFVNQNHDGLFEKAGVSVLHSNLIHGDWFDISNPVVQFSGNLRGDLFQRLLETERTADMVLVGGTSLSGMNADRVAHTCAKRWAGRDHGVLGTVIVTLQRTCLDDLSVVRVWCKTDDFFTLLAEEMKVEVERVRPRVLNENVFLVPYDADGNRLPQNDPRRMILDLGPGSRVRVVHPEASNLGAEYTVAPNRDGEGNWMFDMQRPGKLAIRRRFGRWYVQSAIDGELEQLPCVNCDVHFQ